MLSGMSASKRPGIAAPDALTQGLGGIPSDLMAHAAA
jgi:hypothetical protein